MGQNKPLRFGGFKGFGSGDYRVYRGDTVFENNFVSDARLRWLVLDVGMNAEFHAEAFCCRFTNNGEFLSLWLCGEDLEKVVD